MNVLAFDIETIPDLDAGRRLHGLDGLSDEDVGKAMLQRRRQETGGHRVSSAAFAEALVLGSRSLIPAPDVLSRIRYTFCPIYGS